MAALTAQYVNGAFDQGNVAPRLIWGQLAAATKLWSNCIVARNSSGYLVPASADPTLVVLGRLADSTVDNTSGAAGAIGANVEQGARDYDMGTGINALTAADVGNVVYAQDDHTVSRTSQGGTLPAAGVLLSVFTPPGTSTARAVVQLGVSFLGVAAASDASGALPFTARGVFTSLAAYTVTSGVLEANANGAIAAQDGLTVAVGDVFVLPAVTAGAAAIAAADVGPWLVTSIGAAGAKFAMRRPSWWMHGGQIPQGKSIDVGGEGTKWGGISWKAMCAKSLVVGTGAPLLYPRVDKGTGAVGTQVTALFAWTTAQPTAVDQTAAQPVKAVLVVGNGTGTLDFTGTGVDVVRWTVQNF